jgi:hypothetical protein
MPSMTLEALGISILPNLLDIRQQIVHNNDTAILDVADLLNNLKEAIKMKYFNPETKTFKVFNALYNGETLTAAQARKRFGVGNLSAEVSRIKQNGFAVYAETRVAGNGVAVREYAMGKPSREIVALGYRAKAAGLTLDMI